MLLAEHFTQSPHWEAYIILYFFLAGLAGGCYVLGTLLRLRGGPSAAPVARIAFIVSLVAVAICPILLTVDLGRPERFWHMLIDTGAGTLAFKAYSPMSLGAYGLMLFGVFAAGSGLDALLSPRGRTPLAFVATGPVAVLWMVVGSVLGLFVAAYTGVLLAVSNQPVWSDGWPLGGLFLASALSASAALLVLLARRSPAAEMLAGADRSFVIIEAVLVVLFLVVVIAAGSAGHFLAPVWILLWLLVLAGIAAPFAAHRLRFGAAVPLVVLVGVLALRTVVVLAAQS